ncbi:heparinase II/III-family protein [Paenibacillus sp. TRM 82003]|uniref:heparinase II/III family protein n=1 Tax=Kineococcus sp. TRM81007 TaxID=2925831 RepID=UPI001F5696CD|nr:heparinase II/III family protein [Kineococcus sp. TRM81007]MCI2237292.1 heparinase II/III-family protein [Kineococcus sp. TRM81007]MCI3919351.1 heparinase II/III-family protein [Paenibacillus sp. TRM 82003]
MTTPSAPPAPPSPRATPPGPLLRAWGAAAGTGALRGLLRPPHLALPVPSAAERAVWRLPDAGDTDDTGDVDDAEGAEGAERPGAADATTVRAVLARARGDLGTPWPQPTASGFARYWRDGDRVGYETAVFARQHRLSRAVLAAAVTLEDRWLDEVLDGVVLLCEQSTWCWPAHDDTRTRHGSVLPTVTDPYLDLGAGEVAAQLAWTLHLLGEALEERSPGLRTRVGHEVRTRVLDPYRARRDWHWLGLDGDVHNWNPWILGNVVTAALVLGDDLGDDLGDGPGARAEVVSSAIADVDRYAASLPADGAIDEGFGYWWNGAARLLELLEVLEHATGGALGATGIDPLREVVAFPHRMHLGGPWYLNLADAPARPGGDLPWEVLHRWGRRLDVPGAVALAASHRAAGRPAATEAPGLGRLLRAVTDPAWCTVQPAPPPLERDVWLPSTQVLLARPAAGDSRVVLAVKGGHNGEHHNHDDVGEVVVAAHGVPVLVDPGRPTYTAVTFGPDRYTLWPLQSGWHNVPVVRGHEQLPGRDRAASHVVAAADDGTASLGLELSGTYPGGSGVESWRRTAVLHRAEGRVRVTDAWRLRPRAGEDAGPTRLHWVVAGEVTSLEPGRAVVSGLRGAGTVVLHWEAAAARARLEERALDDPLLADVWGDRLLRLVLELTDPPPAGSFDLHVEVGP